MDEAVVTVLSFSESHFYHWYHIFSLKKKETKYDKRILSNILKTCSMDDCDCIFINIF